MIMPFIAYRNRARLPPMPEAEPPQPIAPFYLIVIDHDRGVFAVEGPMTGRGTPPPAKPATISIASRAARAARIGTHSPRSSARRTNWPASRRAAS